MHAPPPWTPVDSASERSQRLLRRAPTAPPLGVIEPLSRRETAGLLGFASDFKVRQLEKEGHLHPVRGAMGQAWYPREQVLALARSLMDRHAPISPRPVVPKLEPARDRTGVTGPSRAAGGAVKGRTEPMEGWSDADLIAHLRTPRAPGPPGDSEQAVQSGPPGRPRSPTVVDLVVDTGISIARAERVYRFWLAHDRHPAADSARVDGGRTSRPSNKPARVPEPTAPPLDPGPHFATEAHPDKPERSAPASERRGARRLGHDALIRQLRDPDPEVRNRAFRLLRHEV